MINCSFVQLSPHRIAAVFPPWSQNVYHTITILRAQKCALGEDRIMAIAIVPRKQAHESIGKFLPVLRWEWNHTAGLRILVCVYMYRNVYLARVFRSGLNEAWAPCARIHWMAIGKFVRTQNERGVFESVQCCFVARLWIICRGWYFLFFLFFFCHADANAVWRIDYTCSTAAEMYCVLVGFWADSADLIYKHHVHSSNMKHLFRKQSAPISITCFQFCLKEIILS